MPRLIRCLGLIALLLGAAYGCSGSSGTQPASTPNPAAPGATAPPADGVLGVYDLLIDPANGTATLASLTREGSAFGDTYSIDNSGFLAGWPCANCIQTDSVGYTQQGQVYVDFKFRHPFPLPDQQHPSGGDRLDLHLFDFRGIFVFEPTGSAAGTTGFPSLALSGYDGVRGPANLVIDNSGFLAGISLDGMTGMYDSYSDGFFPTSATLHPYSMFLEDTRAGNFDPDAPNGFSDPRDPQGHNVFPMGSGPYTKRVFFDLKPGDPPVRSVMILGANYGVSAVGRGTALGQRMNPVYYLPEFNQKEPWRVKVASVDTGLVEDDPGSSTTVHLEICDWQHNTGTNTTSQLTPAPGIDRGTLRRPSRVTNVRAQLAGVADPEDVSAQYGGGLGTAADPLLWSVTVPNAQDAAEGSYLGLVEIFDEYFPPPEANGGGIGSGKDGSISFFGMGRSATFVAFSATVAPPAAVEPQPDWFGGSGSMFAPSGLGGPGTSLGYNSATYNSFVANSPTVALPLITGALEAGGALGMVGTDLLTIQSTSWGNLWGVPALLNASYLTGNQRDPAIAVGPDHKIYVVYVSDAAASYKEIFMRVSSNLGTTWSEYRRVSEPDNKHMLNPSVGVTSLGRVVVAWQKGSDNKVMAAISDTAGVSWIDDWNEGTDRVVHQTQVLPYAASVRPNGFAILYTQDQKNDRSEARILLYPDGTKDLDDDLEVWREPANVLTTCARGAVDPATGEFHVALVYKNSLTGTFGVSYLRRPALTGVFGNREELALYPDATIEHLDLALKSDGTRLVAWNDDHLVGLGSEVYVTKYQTANGWSAPRPFGTSPSNQRWPQLVFNPQAQRSALIWWDDAYGAQSTSLRFAVEPVD